jgi:hypothetical protein
MLPLVLAVAIAAYPQAPPPGTACPLAPTAPTAFGGEVQPRRLGDLPDANEVRLVLRTVNGCAYQEVTRFNVSSGGGTVPPGGSALVPDGARVTPAAPASGPGK